MSHYKSAYYIGGSALKMDPLPWPIYQNYKIMWASDYVKEKKSVKSFGYGLPEIFSEVDSRIIVPDYSKPAIISNPLNDPTTMFFKFTSLSRRLPSEKYIVAKATSSWEHFEPEEAFISEWVSQYGLPFTTTQERIGDADLIYGSSDIDINLQFEAMLEDSYGEYVMLLDSFIELIDEWNTFMSAYTALTEKDTEKVIDAFIAVGSPGLQYEFLTHSQILELNRTTYELARRDGPKSVVYESVYKEISNRIQKHLRSLTPKLAIDHNSEEGSFMFGPSWVVPDLWSVLILQLYEFFLDNQKMKKCLYCGKYFPLTDPRMRFCPPGWDGNSLNHGYRGRRSYCQNSYAVRDFRKKKIASKRKATDTI